MTKNQQTPTEIAQEPKNGTPEGKKVIGRPFTPETAKLYGDKGREAQRNKRRGRELLSAILSGRPLTKEARQACEAYGLDPVEITNEAALYIAMFEQASAGGREAPRAFEQIAKVMGWQVERHEITGADGAPLIPRTLSPEEVRQAFEELDKDN